MCQKHTVLGTESSQQAENVPNDSSWYVSSSKLTVCVVTYLNLIARRRCIRHEHDEREERIGRLPPSQRMRPNHPHSPCNAKQTPSGQHRYHEISSGQHSDRPGSRLDRMIVFACFNLARAHWSPRPLRCNPWLHGCTHAYSLNCVPV